MHVYPNFDLREWGIAPPSILGMSQDTDSLSQFVHLFVDDMLCYSAILPLGTGEEIDNANSALVDCGLTSHE